MLIAVVASHDLASHHSGWVTIGLNGLLYDWFGFMATVTLAQRVPASRRALEPVFLFIVIAFPAFWAACLVIALGAGWIWAALAGVVVALMANVAVSELVYPHRKPTLGNDPSLDAV
jgi:membrane associated rhomboid family serine protease